MQDIFMYLLSYITDGILLFTELLTDTHSPVFFKCSSNNHADTVLSYFKEAIQKYGLPLHICTNHGGENFNVAQVHV